jgi:heme-degrading monooxygenase HmoA
MYLVVSRWEVLPGQEAEFEKRGRAVREVIRRSPGVVMTHGLRTEDGGVVAVIGYDSKESYDRVVNAEDGPFQKAVADLRLEECGRWISSDRGEAMED